MLLLYSVVDDSVPFMLAVMRFYRRRNLQKSRATLLLHKNHDCAVYEMTAVEKG